MGNIVPRVGTEPTFLTFWASVLSLHCIGFLMSPLYLPVYAAPCLTCQCRLLHSSPWNYKSFSAYKYIHTCICSSLPQRSMYTTTYVWHVILHTNTDSAIIWMNSAVYLYLSLPSLSICCLYFPQSLFSPTYPAWSNKIHRFNPQIFPLTMDSEIGIAFCVEHVPIAMFR